MRCAHFARVPPPVEPHEAADPTQIGFDRTGAVVTNTQGDPRAIDQLCGAVDGFKDRRGAHAWPRCMRRAGFWRPLLAAVWWFGAGGHRLVAVARRSCATDAWEPQ